MIKAPVTLVTVIFSEETNFLRLQARSIARLADPDFIKDIILILNDPESGALKKTLENHVLPFYGSLKNRVRIINGRKLCQLKRHGWRGQQVLKLAIARKIKTSWYCVLDAKNHFIRPFDALAFYGTGLRPWHFDARVSDDMMPARLASLAQFGQKDEGDAEKHLPYITPFPLPTQEVIAMIDYCKRVQGESLSDILIDKAATEFLLFDAWLKFRHKDFTKIYDIRTRKTLLTFWGNSPRTGVGFNQLAAELDWPEVYTFSLHRSLYGVMEPHFRDWVVSIWVNRGLVDTREEAELFLSSPQISLS